MSEIKYQYAGIVTSSVICFVKRCDGLVPNIHVAFSRHVTFSRSVFTSRSPVTSRFVVMLMVPMNSANSNKVHTCNTHEKN